MRIIGDVHGKHEEYHRIIVDGCTFQCLNELEFVDI